MFNEKIEVIIVGGGGGQGEILEQHIAKSAVFENNGLTIGVQKDAIENFCYLRVRGKG